jgi:hypothetical protein
MTATATPSTNGRPQRKQLGYQLDRLDSIIDALAEGLPGAVADACRDGARQAVKDVILELLTNPELRTLIAGLAPPSQASAAAPATAARVAEHAPTKPAFWGRLKAVCKVAREAVARRCRSATAAVVTTARTLSAVLPLRKILLTGAGVGVAVGVVSYACPHAVSAAVGGACAAATAVAVQVGRWVRRSAGLLGLGGRG